MTKQLDKTKAEEEKKALRELLDYYLFATLHLYGIIAIPDFLAIVKAHHGIKLTVADFRQLMDPWISKKQDYAIYRQWLIGADYQGRFEVVERLAENQAHYHRYLPEPFEYVQYADDDYTDNPYLVPLQALLKKVLDQSDVKLIQLLKQTSRKGSANEMLTHLLALQPKLSSVNRQVLEELVTHFYLHERQPDLLGNRPIDYR